GDDRPHRRGRRRARAVGHPRAHAARIRPLSARPPARPRRSRQPADARADGAGSRALARAIAGERHPGRALHEPGDAIIVDGTTGVVHMRPPSDIETAYGERVKLRARRQAQYRALRDKPCVTKDGHKFALMINAGLTIDLPHLDETGAAGIGLFRTELQFMVADTLPRTNEQLGLYRTVLDAAGKRPVTFRTLDIGG